MDGKDTPPPMTEEEKRQSAFTYLQTLEARVRIVENLLLELLIKLKAAGLIVDAEDEDEDKGEE